MIEFMAANKHLIPFFVVILFGGGLMFFSGVLYQVRQKRIIFFYSPFFYWNKHSEIEKLIFKYGTVLFIVGFSGLFFFSALFGYFYFDGNVIVWTK